MGAGLRGAEVRQADGATAECVISQKQMSTRRDPVKSPAPPRSGPGQLTPTLSNRSSWTLLRLQPELGEPMGTPERRHSEGIHAIDISGSVPALQTNG